MNTKTAFAIGIITVSSLTLAEEINLEDFTISVPAHSHSASENQAHAEHCEQMGAIDITDEMDLKLMDKTEDAIVCFKPDTTSLPNYAHINVAIPSVSATLDSSYMLTVIVNYEANGGWNPIIGMGGVVAKDFCGGWGADKMPYSIGTVSIDLTCYAYNGGAKRSYAQAIQDGGSEYRSDASSYVYS